MKKIILFVVLIMGVLSIQSCVRYKIRVVRYRDGSVQYAPLKRNVGMWESNGNVYPTENDSRIIIKSWEEERQFIKQTKKPKYIKYERDNKREGKW